MTPTTETTAAQLLEAQAQITAQMDARRKALVAMIADANAELAMLDGKPLPKAKGRPPGSRNRKPKGTAPQMPLTMAAVDTVEVA